MWPFKQQQQQQQLGVEPQPSVPGMHANNNRPVLLRLSAWISRRLVSDTLFLLVLSVVGVAKKIEWFGPSGDRIELNRPDITVTLNDESSSVLTLYNAGNENEGTYKCVATNGDEQGESTVKVKIFREGFSLIFTPPPPPCYSSYYWLVWA